MNQTTLKHYLVLKVVLFALSLVIIASSYSVAESFEDFMKAQEEGGNQTQQEFDQYKKELEQELRVYKQIVEQEYDRYKNDVRKYWEDTEISGKKKWIEYSPDFRTKRKVDFDQGFIELSVIVLKHQKDLEQKFETMLRDLILEDKQTAFKRDSLSQNIEKRIIKKAKHIKTGRVEKSPIITNMVTGSSQPTRKQVDTSVSALLEKGTITRMPSKIENSDVVILKALLPPESMQVKAKEYKPDVVRYAKQRNISGPLVFAVIHTESAFNPMARSHVPAYGLMQIVPGSAGRDVAEVLYGKQILMSPSFLYNGENNINAGTTYLYILYYRYLKNIESPESRLYCTIAAYNTGAGNVARTFVGSTNINKAVKKINKMSPGKVYKRLMKKLPYDESRHYLERVSKRMGMYETL